MATLLHRVIDNFVYQIKQITPTSTIVRNQYRLHEPSLNEEGWSASRQFYIEWMDSDNDLDASDSDHREAWHNYLVHVFYPVTESFNKMQELVLRDRHDIIKRLRRKEYTIGVSGDSDLDVGIMNRHRVGDELNKDNPDVWEMITKWRCKVQESEI